MNISPTQSKKSRHSKYINLLSQIAINVEPVAQARIAACIVYRKNIISVGFNQKKTHPFQQKYCKNNKSIFLHAETDAIKNAINKIELDKLAKSILYICRVKIINNKFTFGIAKPCDGCMRAISNFDIEKVYYTLDNGGYSWL
jgi:deoxycytidylate deaminase|tara:strand:- start:10723 stop:11151 length:429 start_codon:yes stop_codon:yes gene_type:complete